MINPTSFVELVILIYIFILHRAQRIRLFWSLLSFQSEEKKRAGFSKKKKVRKKEINAKSDNNQLIVS